MAGWRNGFRARRVVGLLALTLGAVTMATSPAAGMRSEKIATHLCKTVHGGRFVGIPGFPGEKIDRRLLPDIRWMKRRFDIFITDGYSTDPVHAGNGEHPIGLATDIVPNAAKGGTWNEVGDLAHVAEPTQNQPIMPWRWVGWNGDAGHGRGDHLHLSWSHSDTKPGHPAKSVYTLLCPKKGPKRDDGASGSGGGDKPDADKPDPPSGGTEPGSGSSSGPSGGTAPKLAPVVAERGGVDG